jgi:hypothetical protein
MGDDLLFATRTEDEKGSMGDRGNKGYKGIEHRF